ncbi:MAG: glycerophosphodiester phosphodiesterase [Lachnospiraceae bacterium]|nr:glycerophosphodiester phosphodiesterase [Lachnospiraceae bacterium]
MIILRILATILVLAGAFYLFSLFPRGSRRADMLSFQGLAFAHRGLHGGPVPENSMPAFAAAVRRELPIELDIHLTRDKKIIVFHDDNMMRLCGVNYAPEDLTWAQIRQLKLAGTNYGVPLFRDVLMMVDGRVPLMIEIKLPDQDTDLCRRVYHLLRNYHGIYMIQSFNTFVLQWFKKNAPHILRGQLSYDLSKKKNDLPAATYIALRFLMCNLIGRPDFISYRFQNRKNISLIIIHYVFRCPTALWTIRNQSDYVESTKHHDMVIFEGFLPAPVLKEPKRGFFKWV